MVRPSGLTSSEIQLPSVAVKERKRGVSLPSSGRPEATGGCGDAEWWRCGTDLIKSNLPVGTCGWKRVPRGVGAG
jgi:hypothetical protein